MEIFIGLTYAVSRLYDLGMTLDCEYLKSRLDYDPVTGDFRWKWKYGTGKFLPQWNGKHAGTKAGSHDTYGYWQIRIDGVLYTAHKLAWLLTYGEWPVELDHINLVKDDNRISNLRLATRRQNMSNLRKPSNNSSGHKNISICVKKGKYVAQLHVNGKNKHLEYFRFDQLDQAIKCVEEARAKYHGEFARS